MTISAAIPGLRLPSDGGKEGREIAAVAGFMPGGSMRHDWIFDVLTDLQDYALANGLPDLARSVEAALKTARREMAGVELAQPTACVPCPRRSTH